jgi:acetyl-CoA carboxylase biotin carboxylase subunit
VNIGPAPSRESYLAGERMIEVAKERGARAIHPGYGLPLGEGMVRARSARCWTRLRRSTAEAIAALGSKTAARKLALENDVPVVPGTTEALTDIAAARELAESFGYPVLLKAAAGGGGKGMRVVREASELEASLGAAQREAEECIR